MSVDSLKQPFLCTCSKCSHVWPVLWLPCDAALIAKATPRQCPWCGQTSGKQIFVATRSDLARYVTWLAFEIVRARAEAADSSSPSCVADAGPALPLSDAVAVSPPRDIEEASQTIQDLVDLIARLRMVNSDATGMAKAAADREAALKTELANIRKTTEEPEAA